ncbi:MAG: ComF family protein [Candidatus Colwellbacteria bacterium]|nr:ComF family protein [Candidatus Colwellbacteria bacterium]
MVSLLDIFFPPICLNCRTYLNGPEEKENLLCDICFTGIKVYSNIFRPDPRFNLMALGSYETSALRELLHYFKYNGFLAARAPLEKLMMRWLSTNPSMVSHFPLPHSLLVPIPLHRNRLRARGFNQAELIAEALSRLFQLPLEAGLLERTRDTKSQIGMKSAKERRENVENSITVRERSGWPQHQNVILVDDVYTSGSTMKEAMQALRRSGAKNITAFVIAKT